MNEIEHQADTSSAPSTPPEAKVGLIARLIKQFSKFIVVGGVNTGIDFAVLNVLMYLSGIGEEFRMRLMETNPQVPVLRE